MQQHMSMYSNYQQTNTHQQQHPQQHSSIQQNSSNVPTSNGGIMSHHTSYTSGLNSTTPNFVPAATMRHGTTTQGGEMGGGGSKHWEQIGEYHKTTEEAHQAALSGNTHYWARTKSGDNRQPATAANSSEDPNAPKIEIHNNTRISNEVDPTLTRQDWNGVDLTGQNLRIISRALFDFKFLGTVYLGSNKLRALPSWFGELRNLYHLDVSHNELTQLPPELGMCVFLKTLLAFNNKLSTIPLELGSLYKLEYLGLNENEGAKDLVEEIMQNGTKSLIKRLLESAPGQIIYNLHIIVTNLVSQCLFLRNQDRFWTLQTHRHPTLMIPSRCSLTTSCVTMLPGNSTTILHLERLSGASEEMSFSKRSRMQMPTLCVCRR